MGFALIMMPRPPNSNDKLPNRDKPCIWLWIEFSELNTIRTRLISAPGQRQNQPGTDESPAQKV